MVLNHIQRLNELDDAWRVTPAGLRLQAVRKAARKLKERLKRENPIESVRTCGLVTRPSPTSYGLGGAARLPMPFAMITNRMMIVRVKTADGTKRILVNPS